MHNEIAKDMMKKAIVAILRYIGAIIGGCVLAGLAASPFLRPGDFSVPFQMIFISVVSGFYIVTVAPLVFLAEILFRRVPGCHLLPIWAIAVFGACFPVIGFALFSRTWWPEEPADMSARHITTFLVLAAFSLGIGAVTVQLRNRRSANTTLHSTRASSRP